MSLILRFLLRQLPLLLFLGLEALALVWMAQSKGYQRSVLVSSANGLFGSVYSSISQAQTYFHLQTVADSLAAENMRLRAALPEYLRADTSTLYIARVPLIEGVKPDSAKRNGVTTRSDTISNTHAVNDSIIKAMARLDSLRAVAKALNAQPQYRFTAAKVINASTMRRANYLTLDKGSLAGIEPGDGVLSSSGIAGVVYSVGERFAVVLSVLHKQFSVGARLGVGGYNGLVSWDGVDPRFAQLLDIPSHVPVKPGMKVVTNSFSGIFPEGMLIGVVESAKVPSGESSHIITVRLATDFGRLHTVTVITDRLRGERAAQEKTTLAPKNEN
jgi:rod shape-determining protein MreC